MSIRQTHREKHIAHDARQGSSSDRYGNHGKQNAAKVAQYSRSDAYVNTEIIKFIEHNCPHGDGTITDATACTGGDSIQFAKRFRHVLCIEKDPYQYEQLVLNFSKTNLQPGVQFSCVNADAIQEVPRRRHNIIYMDAPWGGKDYIKWKDDTLHLYMNDILVEDVCIRWADYTDCIVLKVPYNFALTAFRSRIMQSGRFSCVRTHMIHRPHGNPIGVIYIRTSRPTSPTGSSSLDKNGTLVHCGRCTLPVCDMAYRPPCV
jgi:predicted RNA methylase